MSDAETNVQNAVAVEKGIMPIAETVANVLGQPEIALVLGLLDKYGPTLATTAARWLSKKTVTLDDVEAAFAPLKPYSAYGIPDVAPTVPVAPPSSAPVQPIA